MGFALIVGMVAFQDKDEHAKEGLGFGSGSGGELVSGRTTRILGSSWASCIRRQGLIVRSIALSGLETMS